MAEFITVDSEQPDPKAIAHAAEALRSGRLVAFPTETVYGLGANALDARAVRRIFEAKGRPSTDPLIVHVGSLDAAATLVTHLPPVARLLAWHFWPGPLTLVLPKAPHVPGDVTAGLASVALRVPAHPVALALVEAAGVPVAAPSANLFSRPSPTCAQHVQTDLADQVDIILDGGATSVGVESTVVDLTVEPPVILRPGGVSLDALRRIVPSIEVRAVTTSAQEAAVAPGLLDKHYAPRTPMMLVEGEPAAVHAYLAAAVQSRVSEGQRVAVLATRDHLGALGLLQASPQVTPIDLGPADDLGAVAAVLYQRLRDCDASGSDIILAAQVASEAGLGLALRDRLRRAAAGHVITA